MKKILSFIILSVFCLNTLNAEVTWNLSDDGTLTISGTDMPNYSYGYYDYAPWYSQRAKIKKVIIENGVTCIGDCAFIDCSALTSITTPNSVTRIGDYAFARCSGLTSVTIPNSVTSIGNEAFWECKGLTSAAIPNSVISIGVSAYSGCNELTSVNIANSVTSIGTSAFSYCSGLTSITIPNSVTSIGNGVFEYCPYITSIKVEEGNEKYDSRNNCNAIIEKETNTLIAGCENTIIPNSVKCIGHSAFAGCKGLTSIIIPNSVTSIGGSAFSNCSNLRNVTISNSLESIGGSAFWNCGNLISITIPSSVTTIDDQAFYYCNNLSSITCEATTPPDCGTCCFLQVHTYTPVYVPANSIDAYKAAKEWKKFTDIKAIPNKQYWLNDGQSYINDTECKDADIIYTRTFNNTAWQALYIPFSLNYDDWKDEFEVAYINGVRQLDKDDDGTIDETIMDVIKIKSGSTSPNMPYLIKAKTVGTKNIYVTNTILYAAEENSVDCSTTIAKYTFTGTYNTIPSATMIANEYYAMGGGDLIQSDGSNDLMPYRWYMKVESRNHSYKASNAAKTITINVIGDEEEKTTTGIHQLQITNDELPVYDLNGRKVNGNNLKPGIYVKNGKKVIIK